MKKSKKRYWFSVVEEMVQNPKFQNFRGGRVEVYDQKDKKAYYAIYEARFWLPQEFMDGFRELFDDKESDEMPRISWDIERDKRETVEREQLHPQTVIIDSIKKIPKITGYEKLAKEVFKPISSLVADGSQEMRRSVDCNDL